MTQTFDKSRLPSRHVSVGPERAPHRSYYYAMGISEEDIAKPFVALASAGNDSAPCNTVLDVQADPVLAAAVHPGASPADDADRRHLPVFVTSCPVRRSEGGGCNFPSVCPSADKANLGNARSVLLNRVASSGYFQ